jgi:hypothetical protein
MMRKAVCPVILFLVLGTLILSSCDEFYSSTWGTTRKYEGSKIDLNAGNLDAWVETAIGNPELANALLEKIKDDLPGLSGKDKAKYQDTGVKLAVEASGIGSSILSNAAVALDQLEKKNSDAVKDILSNIQNDFKKNNGAKAAKDIAEIVDVPDSDKPPEIQGDYALSASASDVGQAVMVLALAVIGDINETTNLNVNDLEIGLTFDGGKVEVAKGKDALLEARVLAAYLNLIADGVNETFDSNPITKAIKDAFGVSKGK